MTHPATLLDGNDAPHRPETAYADDEFMNASFNEGVAAAAEYLREYERVNGLTFVALDDGTRALIPESTETMFRIVDASARENPKTPNAPMVTLVFATQSGPLKGERFSVHVNPLRLHSEEAVRAVCDLADVMVIGSTS